MFACETSSGLFCCCGVFMNGRVGGWRERQSSWMLTDALSENRVSGKVLFDPLALRGLQLFFQVIQLFFQVIQLFFQAAQPFSAVQDIPAFFIKP